jgi:hypothetical protein
MSYRNIDSILRDRKIDMIITGQSTGTPNTSKVPEKGEEVGVETTFSEYLKVEINSINDEGNIFQGTAKHEVFEGDIGEQELIVKHGEMVEFSQPKIYAIHRGDLSL